MSKAIEEEHCACLEDAMKPKQGRKGQITRGLQKTSLGDAHFPLLVEKSVRNLEEREVLYI